MLKLMELSMAAGLTFTWDAKFGYLKFVNCDVHIAGEIYDIYHKNNVWATHRRTPDEVVDFICGGLT